jgi:hypothetical protein
MSKTEKIGIFGEFDLPATEGSKSNIPCRALLKNVHVWFLGTRFTNAISCFEPGLQELTGTFLKTPCRGTIKYNRGKKAFFRALKHQMTVFPISAGYDLLISS